MTKSKIYIILLWFAASFMVACSDIAFDEDSQDLVPMTIEALSESTRTVLDGTSVLWSEGDEAAVYDFKTTKHRFTSQTTDGRTKFVGKVTAKSEPFAAIYPYDLAAEAGSSASALGATLPAEQYAVLDGFPAGMNISVAKGARNIDGSPSNVTFHNVCQLLRFSVPAYAANKVTRITFTAQTPVAGKLNIDYSGTSPVVSIASTESKVITVLPPSGSSTFAAGTYYILTAPVQLNGFSMTMQTADNKTYRLASDTQFGGAAGHIYSLGNIDLVNTPSVTATHVYADGILQGTKVTLTGAPVEDVNWTATIKNASGTTVRTLSGTGDLTSDETDASWPYLPKGDYTVTYHYTTSNNKAMTKTLSLTVPKMTHDFSVSFSTYTSYSYYSGDGVTRNITQANACANNIIYEPTLKVTGIANNILNNTNYKFTLTPSGYSTSLKSGTNGTYVYNNVSVTDWKAYTLSCSLAFDGVTKSGSKTVYITGLPYTAAPPKNSGNHAWSEVQGGSKIDWNNDNVSLGDGGTATSDPTIKSPEFYLPNGNINVVAQAQGTLHTRQVWPIYYSETLTMYVGGTSIWSQESPQKSTTPASINPVINTTFGNGSNYLRFSVGARTALSGFARINSVNIQYR